MHKFCPNCGVKLDGEFKFCPECGYALTRSAETSEEKPREDVEEKKSPEVKGSIFVCEICGEENSSENSVCAGCGAKLNNPNAKVSQPVKKNKPSINKNAPKNKGGNLQQQKMQQQNKKTPVSAFDKKSLNKAKIISVVAIGFGIALLILIFSGALDSIISPSPKQVQNQVQNQDSSVNLASIQKINELEETVKNNPKDTSAILDLAHAKNDAGMFEQAIENYKQYLKLVPKDPDARIDMGICYYNLKDFDTAISEMQEAVKIDPQHQIGFLDLGIVSLAKGDMQQSREFLQKAVQLDPGSDYGKKAEELLKSHNTNNGGN